jgi:curved DNA-binding protein CbpA
MEKYTYYDILGVSQNATIEEITKAKNNLAKIYHPDANSHSNIDTTIQMQEVLEAYQFLIDENNRALNLENGKLRTFQTFTMNLEMEKESDSFVELWQVTHTLHASLSRFQEIYRENNYSKIIKLPFFNKLAKASTIANTEHRLELQKLKDDISIAMEKLSKGNVPVPFWSLDAMNWVLVRWGQKQGMNYLILFHRYEQYVESNYDKEKKAQLKKDFKYFNQHLSQIMNTNYL